MRKRAFLASAVSPLPPASPKRSRTFEASIPLSHLLKFVSDPSALLVCNWKIRKLALPVVVPPRWFRSSYLWGGTTPSDVWNLVQRMRVKKSAETRPHLTRDLFPPHLTELQFDLSPIALGVGVLPNTLRTLDIGAGIEGPIRKGIFPQSLLKLDLGYNFNQPLEKDLLPSRLRELSFSILFDQKIEPGALPATLYKLVFRESFNQRLDPGVLPSGLQVLVFADCFDHPLHKESLPLSLTTLDLGLAYNQPLEGVLPSSLLKLKLSVHFNQPLHVFPPQVRVLYFGHLFDQPLFDRDLPDSLTELQLCLGPQISARACPKNLQTLILSGFSPSGKQNLILPLSLTRFEGFCSDRALRVGDLPPHLTSLCLNSMYDHPIEPGALPTTLTALDVGISFNQAIGPQALPPSVRFLRFGTKFNQPLPSLPSTLTHLSISDSFNQPLDNVLPPTLTRLSLGASFRQPLAGVLPLSLSVLHLSPASFQCLQVIEGVRRELLYGDPRQQEYQAYSLYFPRTRFDE